MPKDKYNGMKKAKDWVGKTVRAKKELVNSVATIPVGYVGTITYQSTVGLTFEGSPCKCCGMKAHITRIGYFDIELVESTGS